VTTDSSDVLRRERLKRRRYLTVFGELVVPILKGEPAEHRVRLRKGQKHSRKKELALSMLGGFTLVLDLFHALEYLWKAAYAFHPEGSDEAEAFVRHRLRMLLEGKVGRVIGGLRQMLTKHSGELTKAKRKRLETTIRYYEANRRWMHYDVYLAAGYPIGSGAAEGACRHRPGRGRRDQGSCRRPQRRLGRLLALPHAA